MVCSQLDARESAVQIMTRPYRRSFRTRQLWNRATKWHRPALEQFLISSLARGLLGKEPTRAGRFDGWDNTQFSKHGKSLLIG